jgi:hypothetical protein
MKNNSVLYLLNLPCVENKVDVANICTTLVTKERRYVQLSTLLKGLMSRVNDYN